MEKTLQTVQTISLRGSVIALDVQDTVKVPFGVRSASYVRHIAAMVGMEMDRQYTVHTNREAKVYEITRAR